MTEEVCTTYAAVAANNSALRALVRIPMLLANMIVKAAIIPNFLFGDLTTYKLTIAPMSSTAARMMLNMATNRAMR